MSNIEEEIEITRQPKDYLSIRYRIDQESNQLRLEINAGAPNNLSTNQKGDIGEHLAKEIIQIKDLGSILIQQKRGHVFDLINSNNGITYDAKFALEKGKQGASHWMFYISSGRPFRGAIHRSPSKFMRDYAASGIDYLVCVGAYKDRGKPPAVYVIPTNCEEVIQLGKITIATSGRGKYEQYRIPIREFHISSVEEGEN